MIGKATSTDVQLALASELRHSKRRAKPECNRGFATVAVSGGSGDLTILMWLSDTGCKAEPLFKLRLRQMNRKKKSACDMVKTWEGSHKADAELKRTRLHTARPAKGTAQKPGRLNRPRNKTTTEYTVLFSCFYTTTQKHILASKRCHITFILCVILSIILKANSWSANGSGGDVSLRKRFCCAGEINAILVPTRVVWP